MRKIPKTFRRFNHRIYSLVSLFSTKKHAQIQSKLGNKRFRIIKTKLGYALYKQAKVKRRRR